MLPRLTVAVGGCWCVGGGRRRSGESAADTGQSCHLDAQESLYLSKAEKQINRQIAYSLLGLGVMLTTLSLYAPALWLFALPMLYMNSWLLPQAAVSKDNRQPHPMISTHPIGRGCPVQGICSRHRDARCAETPFWQ